jgi:phage shock protein PspC (stress-responsive transcriptional regulator)
MTTTLDPPPAPDPVPPPSPPSPPPRPRLARNTEARVLGGVAAGIADHFGIDPLLVRLAFVVTAFFGGLGVLAYVVAWIVLPSSTPGSAPAPRDNRQLLGFGLVAVGLATIPSGVGFGLRLDGAFWPLALVALGGTVLWLRTRDDYDDHDAPPAPPPDAAFSTVPAVVPTTPVESPASTPPGPTAAPAPTSDSRRVRRDKPPRGPVTAITLSVLLILGGLAWLVAAAGWVTVDAGVLTALALTIVGIGLVASAWIGRARGLIALGVVLALAVGAFAAIDVPLRGDIGESTYRPVTAAGVHDRYQMAIGRLEVDLRSADLARRRTEVLARVGIGRVVVRVPDDVRLVVHGHAGVGAVSLLGRDHGSCCPKDEHLVRRGVPGGGTLVLDTRVGVGAVEVTDAPDRGRPSREVRDAAA